jgi:hypothetical protein
VKLIESLELGVRDESDSPKATGSGQRFRQRTFGDVEELQVFRKAASS